MDAAALTRENVHLKTRLAEVEAALAEVQEANRRLEDILLTSQRAQFGKRSEKLSPDQFNLALEDAELAQGVLEAAARTAVGAWAEAVDGEDEPLERVASPEAVATLLYGGDATRKTRLVVRGPRVKRIRIAAVQVEQEPATMTIDVELGGRRYVEDRDTAAVLDGSKDSASTFTERWTLALAGPDDAPWQVVATA